jgi:hypothetical protein
VEADWWKRNAIALLALAPVVIAAARIVGFSRGDPALLAALVQDLNVPAVILGGVVPFLGVVLAFALNVVIANRHITPLAGRWLKGLGPFWSGLLNVTVLLIVVTTPLRDALALVLLPLIGWGYRVVSGRMDRREGRYIPADVTALVAGYVLLFLQTWGPWMSEEALRLDDGSTRSAYVVASVEGWTTLVDADSRHVSRIRSVTILEREVCGSGRGPTLLHVLSGSSVQPPCPDRASAPNLPSVSPPTATGPAPTIAGATAGP